MKTEIKPRELKFRIWCRGWKPPRFAKESELIIFGCNKSFHEFLDIVTGNNLYIVQQYIGINDKNARPIYEGDIVKECSNVVENTFVTSSIEWSYGGFALRHISGSVLRNLLHDIGGDCSICGTLENSEIIGNIFENPELLN